VTPLDVQDLGKHIGELLANPSCSDFVSNLIGTVAETNPQNPAHSVNAAELFKMIREGSGGYVLENRLAGGTVGGSISAGNATVYISFGSWPGGLDADKIRLDQYTYAAVALHETIHHAGQNGYYSDERLARAALALTGIESNFPIDPTTASTYAWSRYWNDILKDRCPPVRRRP
jgi:hypothetical protein